MTTVSLISFVLSFFLIGFGYYTQFTEGKANNSCIVFISIGLVILCVSAAIMFKGKKNVAKKRLKGKLFFIIKLMQISPPLIFTLLSPSLFLRCLPAGHYSLNGLFIMTFVIGLIGYAAGEFLSNRLKRYMLK